MALLLRPGRTNKEYNAGNVILGLLSLHVGAIPQLFSKLKEKGSKNLKGGK